MRLRAACFGRQVREEEEEHQGGSSSSRVVEVIHNYLDHGPLDCEAPVEGDTGIVVVLDDEEGGEGGEGVVVITLPNGMVVRSVEGAKEDLAFIYNEVVAEEAYWRHGVRRLAVAEAEEGVVVEGSSSTKTGVVVDVGAHIGLVSCLMGMSGWVVVAVEAAPVTYRALHWNVRRYCPPQSRAINVAVGGRSGGSSGSSRGGSDVNHTTRYVDLHYYPHLPGNSTISRASVVGANLNPKIKERLLSDAVVVSCPVKTLGEILVEEFGVTLGDRVVIELLKIDVEGMEAEVMEGIDDWDMIRQVRETGGFLKW